MQLIECDAVQKLFEKVESLAQQPHESWKCVHLKLRESREPSKNDVYTSFIIKHVTHLLAYQKGTIYFCNDGDIFILFQGAISIVTEKLHSHFGDFEPHQLAERTQDSLFRLFEFDLGKTWETFYTLCQNKFLNLIVASEMQVASEKARSNVSDIIIQELRRMVQKSVPAKKHFTLPKMFRPPVQEQAMPMVRDA